MFNETVNREGEEALEQKEHREVTGLRDIR